MKINVQLQNIHVRNRMMFSRLIDKIRRYYPYPEITGILCAIGTIFCTYVLVKWNTIPVYDYYIEAEYYCPDTITKNLQTGVALFIEPDGLLNSYSNQSEGQETFVISIEDSTKSLFPTKNEKKNHYTNRDSKVENLVSQKWQHYTEGLFDDTICSFLSREEKPDRLFYVHLYFCAEQENIFVKADTNVLYSVKDTLTLTRNNDRYCISILNRKIDSIFHSHEFKPLYLSDEHIYCHYSVLKMANNSDPFTNRIEGKMKRNTYRKNKLQTILMPKDISRAYYRLSFSSSTIPTYNLRFNFTQDVVFESLPDEYEVGVNMVKMPNIETSCVHSYRNVKLYAEFPDGENVQTVRTFFMALIITGLLKELLKSSYRSFRKYVN